MSERLIRFSLVYQGRERSVSTYCGEYDSLLELISETIPVRSFGICYGGGCCGTCGVRLQTMGCKSTTFLPACEIQIDERLSHKKIIILRD